MRYEIEENEKGEGGKEKEKGAMRKGKEIYKRK